MPGTGTLGKLFLQNFLEDFGRRWKSRFCRKETDEMNKPVEKQRLSSHYVPISRLAGRVASCQENNPAQTAATARRFRRAPAG